MIGLVDGDIILHRAAVANEVEVQWDDDNHVLTSNFPKVQDHIKTAIAAIKADLGLETLWIAFTGQGNFRKDLTDTYKAHRKPIRKPMCYTRAKDWMFDTYNCKQVDGLEGDDLLGIWQTRAIKNGHEPTVIVSADKDMKTIPGFHAVFVDEKWVLQDPITEQEADYSWMFQTLTGDTADGYKGLPGCGPVKATKILGGLEGLDLMWSYVKCAYEKAGLSEEDALLQARLARILRVEDWDNVERKVKLWTPQTTKPTGQ